MKFFKPRLVNGGVLYDGDSTTNMPEVEKLKASQKMNKDRTGRIFAAFTRAEEQALAQLINRRK